MENPLTDSRFDQELLAQYRFDLSRWQTQVAEIQAKHNTGLQSFVTGRIEAPADIPELRYDGSPEELLAREAGLLALAKGQVAVLVLNGGLATRFGGVVKGILEVFDQKSFLALKAEDARRAAETFGAKVPLVLLNSFSTGDATKAHFEGHDYFGLSPTDVYFMDQTISVRLDLEGNAFFGKDGKARYYAPGHGEFFDVLIASGIRDALLARGVKWFMFSNVDNLGATLDPAIVGKHILSSADMTVELIAKRKNAQGQWDVGGSPVLVDGELQVVEGFRFPPELPQESLRDFQTNNMLFSLDALGTPMDLPRYLVSKTVDGQPSLAFEAISCEASGHHRPDGTKALKLGLVRVPREGDFGRFYPVKSREDLEALRAVLRERLAAGWAERSKR